MTTAVTTVKKKKLSKKSKIKIALLVILAVVLLLPIIWWGVIYFFGPEKYVSKTFNMDWLVTADESDTQPIFEVKYHKNKNNDGLEMFELKLNYFQDEEKNNIYSQGLQFVSNDEYTPIDFSFYVDDSKPATRNEAKDYNAGIVGVSVYDAWGGYKMNGNNSTYYNYMSDNDYATTTASTNPIHMDSKLKIELSSSSARETYWLGLKGTKIDTSNIEPESKVLTDAAPPFWAKQVYYYSYVDYNYLAKYLYDSVKPLKSGTSEVIISEFGNIFDFYKYDEGKREYTKVTLDPDKDADGKVIEEVKSYCSIKIQVLDEGAKTYEDSLFKVIKNDGNFNLTPDRIKDDYFITRSIIACTNKDFDYVPMVEGYVALKLKQNFINAYLQYKNRIELSILIDLDELEKEGYQFFGFADDSGLENFNIKEAYTLKGQDKSEVTV